MTILAQAEILNDVYEVYQVNPDRKSVCFINLVSGGEGIISIYLKKAGSSGGLENKELFLKYFFEEVGSFATVSILLNPDDRITVEGSGIDNYIAISVIGEES